MLGRIKAKFRRPKIKTPTPFLSIRPEDMPDPDDRALYEAVINAALRGNTDVLAQRTSEGLVVDGELYESAESAREAERAKHDQNTP